MKSVEELTGRGGSTPARREINQHMNRKHQGAPALTGDTFSRLVAHEELHTSQHWDHEHDDFELPAEWHIARKSG